MNKVLILSIFLGLQMNLKMNAQNFDLKQHRWQDRVIIIKSNDRNNGKFKEQLRAFEDHNRELTERKLILYQIINESINYKDFETKKNKIFNISDFKDNEAVKKPTKDFEFILIGLDGGIKMRKEDVVSLNSLFKTIDAMPMRQNEIKRQGQE
jgi:hypothetical protein